MSAKQKAFRRWQRSMPRLRITLEADSDDPKHWYVALDRAWREGWSACARAMKAKKGAK